MQEGFFMAKIKAIIFDLDGVLVDAKDWHYESLNKALGLFGMEISRYDHLITYDGLPTKKKLEMLTLEMGLPKELHSFINELKQIYTMQIIHAKCKPVFQHEYAISKLKTKGYKLAVCSNAIKVSVETMLHKSNLLDKFELVMSFQDVEIPKPNPMIYLNAMEKLGVTPEECLILEDNENGIKAAIASGGHLLKVNNVYDVSYEKIKDEIKEIEEERK